MLTGTLLSEAISSSRTGRTPRKTATKVPVSCCQLGENMLYRLKSSFDELEMEYQSVIALLKKEQDLAALKSLREEAVDLFRRMAFIQEERCRLEGKIKNTLQSDSA